MMYFNKLDGEVVQEIGTKLRDLRKSNLYSQQELADKVGVNRRLIGEIEAGKGTSLLVFVKILKVFNKTERLLEILTSPPAISAKDMFEKENK
jgi:transcriptional regulator with XRE-family HTH domain